MEADILMKSLSKNKHDRCVRQLGLSGASIKGVLEGNQLNELSTRYLEPLVTVCYMLLIY